MNNYTNKLDGILFSTQKFSERGKCNYCSNYCQRNEYMLKSFIMYW